MTDHKFTDDDVIKALRELQEMSEFTPPICHYEKDITEPPFCKPYEQFQNDVKVALALINRQKVEIESLKIANEKMYSANKEQEAEIESLNAVHADMTESLRLAAEANKDMQAAIERLESLCEKIGIANDAKFERICVLQEDLETAKSEAVKEFAERLKANMSNIARMEYGGNVYFCVGYDLIDSLVKEMTEESK